MTLHQEDLSLALEEQFLELTMEFLTRRSMEPALRQLLSEPGGEWQLVETLLDGNMRARLLDLQAHADVGEGQLYMMWLPYPPAHGDYALIVFFLDEVNLDTVAVYNKARLLHAQDADIHGTGTHTVQADNRNEG